MVLRIGKGDSSRHYLGKALREAIVKPLLPSSGDLADCTTDGLDVVVEGVGLQIDVASRPALTEGRKKGPRPSLRTARPGARRPTG